MGAPGVAGMQAAAQASGTTKYTKPAIEEKVRTTIAMVNAADAYTAGLLRAVGTGDDYTPALKREFDRVWNRNFDPNIFRAMDAKKHGDSAWIEKYMGQFMGKDGPARLREFAKKERAIRALTGE
jgi:hypothetical protein